MTEEEIATSKAYGFDREQTIENIAWREAYKAKYEMKINESNSYYKGFLVGFAYKFKGEV
jgi:hypothetical protein